MGGLFISYSNLLLFHAGSTLMMAGVIWVIQLVHYPLFAFVGEAGYQEYQAQHMRRITWLVGPLMLTEAGATALLCAQASPSHAWLSVTGASLLVIIWLSTATLQVPAHTRLTMSWHEGAHRRLVWSNWLRTVGWSARGVVALSLMT